jgi:predicted protein tyrosine phosphatase
MPQPFKFTICGRREVNSVAHAIKATHVLSLLDIGILQKRPINVMPENHLVLNFEDSWGEHEMCAPTREDVSSILKFGKRIAASHTLLVHCHAGISRSTASAFLLLVQAMGIGSGREAMNMVIRNRPQLAPNPLIIRHGSVLLQMPELIDIADDIVWALPPMFDK